VALLTSIDDRAGQAVPAPGPVAVRKGGQVSSSTDHLLRELVAVVGAAHVLTEPGLRARYETDWTGRFHGVARAVVRPRSTEEVSAVVRVCDEARVGVVPQGGNTGLVGGGVPRAGEVVLDLSHLDDLGPVDDTNGQVTADAGVTIAAIEAAARAVGWHYAVDLAARDTATVGGTIATNAGGLHVLRHGATRAQLLGIEAVLADGRVISHLGGLVKDNTGYDLAGLVCGSEGTLAVVTRARLRLVPAAAERCVALLALDSLADAARAVGRIRREVPDLDAAEVFFDEGLALVCTTFDLPRPFRDPSPCYVLVEASGPTDPTDRVGAAVVGLPGVVDVAVATEARRRAQLWRYREDHTSAINSLGPPHKLDVSLPGPELVAFADAVPEVVRRVAPGAAVWIFGHLGDGNLHVNVTGVAPDDEHVDDAVLHLVAEHGGSISAEHGIGVAKKPWLHLGRSPVELAVFASIKRALDPHNTLNPGVIFDLEPSR
jgi:FAD/FMN-containing dehydrogenase